MCAFVTILTSNSLTDKRQVLSAPHLSMSKVKNIYSPAFMLKNMAVSATVIYTAQRMNQPLHQKKIASKLLLYNIVGRCRSKQTVNHNNAE